MSAIVSRSRSRVCPRLDSLNEGSDQCFVGLPDSVGGIQEDRYQPYRKQASSTLHEMSALHSVHTVQCQC